ncbi:ATP-dependent helicase/nuclease subunit A [Methanomicrobium sp. W14]|uniref:UvrD-helicase domain-containing protein n=1 Tax=Methanomicrobium sp. W14 TaxID=2817839 RepID=UPI001AE10375|nr:UvrD-helicase domain-containing protein [Methanomicrobium sp. W14]MBP2134332.1 ATP-dependent helicase/nuclease subunit A [Methanomicrobium sp. W14]
MLTDRQKEAMRHDISLCVTAGAGTGKTHVLVNRYISLIEDAGCRPSEILALTFTDKAAAEMKERVEKEIFEKEGPFWDQIKEEMMWANISTFHSFCSKVLREFPVEAGIEPGFSVLTDSESEDIIKDTINSLFTGKPDPFVKESLDECLCTYGTYYLELFLREMHRKRRYANDFFEALENSPEKTAVMWKEALLQEKLSIATEFWESSVLPKAAGDLFSLSESFAGDGDKGAKYLKSVKEFLILLKSEDPRDICRGLLGIAETAGGSKSMGSKKVFGDFKENLISSYSALKDYADGLPGDILAAETTEDTPETKRTLKILKSLYVVYREMEKGIRREKHARGAVDFTDMINLTYSLFRKYPDIVAKSYSKRFKYVMIDEFQDTDPVQAEITSYILNGGKQKDNRKCSSIFVVGDPKQSIYLFRDADVTQFRRSGEKIKNEYKGDLVSLDINFRSTKEVLSFVNRIFGEILKETKKPWDFGYEPVRVSEKRAEDCGSVGLIITPPGKTVSERAVFEADAVARKIRIITGEKKVLVSQKPASWQDIAILIERRNNLKYIEYSLKKYGIPYRVYGGLGLYEKQEVLDAGSVLSFLKNPKDDSSLYAALRSPFFGFSDAEIFRICNGYAEGLFEKLKRDESEKSKNACRLLSSWLLYARRVLPSALFRKIISESGIYAVYAGVPGGGQAMANLEKLSDIIREREKGGFYTLDRLVSELSSSVSSGEKEGEAEPENTGGDAVTIMTVHASKGLEFPVVIIPGLSDSSPSDNSPVVVDGELGVGIKIPDFETGDDYVNSPPLMVQKYRQRQKMQAEKKRLFYVAATRARDHLIMCASEPKEMPSSFEACKTRADWVMFCLLRGKDGLHDGVYETVCDGEKCTVKVTRAENLADFGADEKKPKYVHLPKNIPAPENYGKSVWSFPEARLCGSHERVFSATEIEDYLRKTGEIKTAPQKKAAKKPSAKDGLKMADRGTFIHEIFAGKDLPAVLWNYPEVREDEAQLYAGMYRKFLDSEFMKDVKRSYCELSFKTGIAGYKISGAIDRLVEKTDGWYVIDYKTGDETEEDHSVQMGIYKEAAEGILKLPVKTVIYKTSDESFNEVPINSAELRDRVSKTCDKMTREIYDDTDIQP